MSHGRTRDSDVIVTSQKLTKIDKIWQFLQFIGYICSTNDYRGNWMVNRHSTPKSGKVWLCHMVGRHTWQFLQWRSTNHTYTIVSRHKSWQKLTKIDKIWQFCCFIMDIEHTHRTWTQYIYMLLWLHSNSWLTSKLIDWLRHIWSYFVWRHFIIYIWYI